MITDKEREKAFADLVAIGWSANAAWKIVIGKGLTWNSAALKEEQEKLLASPNVQKRIAIVKGQLEEKKLEAIARKQEQLQRQNVKEATSKEAMLAELLIAKQKMDIGSREWIDINKMIADINRLKQEEVKTDDDTIHYFLPLQCNQCPLKEKQ